MRKASIDRSWTPENKIYVVRSTVMPGYNLHVWRTDGVRAPPDSCDIGVLAQNHFDKNRVTHLRNYGPDGPSRTFDVAVVAAVPGQYRPPCPPEPKAG